MKVPPHNVASLERALRRISGSDASAVRMRTTIANVVAGQFLEGAVMRGGGALKLRYGDGTTRFTMDFDACRSVPEDEFVTAYSRKMTEGWAGFSGRLVMLSKAHPRNVPQEYVMRPFEVKLTYRGHPWCTVDLEVTYNEIGDADEADMSTFPDDILSLFRELGFPEPCPVPLMRIPYQIAQKLHGVTDTRSPRVQDLIDLQLMADRENIDYRETNAICRRLFANRRLQSWPASVEPSTQWPSAYEAQRRGLPSLRSLDEAVKWVNEFILAIAEEG